MSPTPSFISSLNIDSCFMCTLSDKFAIIINKDLYTPQMLAILPCKMKLFTI